MPNLNKLFPRLSIRAKLAIALAGVALVPLAIVSISGARASVAQIRGAAQATIENDLRLAEMQTARSLDAAESHVVFLAQSVLGPLLMEGVNERAWRPLALSVSTLVATEPTLRQVKLIDADGSERLIVRGNGGTLETTANERGTFYAWRAQSLAADDRMLVPIELPDTGATPAARPIAAIAIVVPIVDDAGEYYGAVVGEAYAARLLSDLELASPGFHGVTVLVDRDGHYLYHSVRKREWASLLATRDRLNLQSDVPRAVATAITSGGAGTLTSDDGIYAYRPVRLGSTNESTLTLFRRVPLDRLTLPVDRFLRWVTLGGGLVAGGVLILAMVAATQFTSPIYRIREAAWRLARNEPLQALHVETNDEFEDLARDFTVVASAIDVHRQQREALIAERTRLLETTHAQLDEVLAHSADAIIGLDPRGCVRVWNHGATRLFGYAASEAMGEPIASLIEFGAQPDRERRFLERELARAGEVVNYRTVRRTAEGHAVPVSLTQTLVRDREGRLLGASLIARDDQLQSRLDEQMRRSERLATMSVVAAGLAHEINNPLAIIANRIELMQRVVDALHVECVDCHNPHRARDGNALEGMRGISLSGTVIESVRNDSTALGLSEQYAVCLRCHGDTYNAALPPVLASGLSPSNKRLEFQTSNSSFHPVGGPGRNNSANLNAQLTPFGLRTTSVIRCTDCHNSNAFGTVGGKVVRSVGAASGPHGSSNASLLRANYRSTLNLASYNSNNFALCFLCHNESALLGNATNFYDTINGKGNLHELHLRDRIDKTGAICKSCHFNIHSNVASTTTQYTVNGATSVVPSSAATTRLVNFHPNVRGTGGRARAEWWIDTATRERRCYLACHTVSGTPGGTVMDGTSSSNGAKRAQYRPSSGDVP